MRRTLLYARVSTNEQTTEQQIDACIKYADTLNLTINKEDIIVDEGISAYSTSYTEREGLMKVIELSSANLVENLIIFSTDRLSRDHLQGQIIINQLSQYNVKIYSVNEGHVNKTEIDNLLNSIRFFQNQIESRKTSQRIKAKKDLMAKERKWLGNHLPIGYSVSNGHIVINEDTKDIAIDMFQTYLKYGSNATVRHLQDVYNINVCRVIEMLQNRHYIGYPYKGAKADYYFEELQIIPNELWDAVQLAIKERTTKGITKTDKTNCLLEGILYHCCGAKMTISKDKRNKYTYYRCRCKCTPKNFTQYKLDEIVDNIVSEWFSQLDKNKLIEKFNSSRSTEYKKLLELQTRQRELLSTKKVTLRNAQNKLQEAFSKDYPLDMIKILTDSINELRMSITELQEKVQVTETNINNQLAIKEKQTVLTEQLLDFKYLYSKATITEKKVLLRAIADKVIITNYDNIEVIYKY